MRRCVGCNTSKPKAELIRMAAYEGEISIDETGRSKGRGVYVCPDSECMEKAKKRKAISRSVDFEIDGEMSKELFEKLGAYERKD